jgi:hypothetical protein
LLLLSQQARDDGAGLIGGIDLQAATASRRAVKRMAGVDNEAFGRELPRQGDGMLPGGGGSIGGVMDGDPERR